MTLHLATDLGSIKIVTVEPGAAPVVSYTVHIQTDADAPLAKHLLSRYELKAKATPGGVEILGILPKHLARSAASAATQFWVQFEVTVPRTYNLEVTTGGGDIQTQDIGGIANLTTEGGNIRTGRIGLPGMRSVSVGHAVGKLETQGGHIFALDVAGDLSAITAGGHIIVRNVAGSATLHSGGGDVRVCGEIGGRADLQTDGGNITVGRATSVAMVRTGGGQIDFGDVSGSVHAQTGGGGIRIMNVSGPMEVESSAGSICLTRVTNSVRAATSGGTITAWISPDGTSSGRTVSLAGASQLTSGQGDIVVYLPRNLAVNIDALVQSGGLQRIEADPAIALTIQSAERGGVQAMGALNGGGAPLKLRTTAGRIRLQYIDSQIALRNTLIEQQRQRLLQNGIQATAIDLSAFQQFQAQAQQAQAQAAAAAKGFWADGWLDRFQAVFMGTVHVDLDEFMKHLTARPNPVYPQIARRASIQGMVRLQVHTTPDGHIEVEKILEGSPALADAAMDALKQWRVSPFMVDGRQVNAVSTVSFNFELH
jgi:TonB family protein